jgi:hypothetical protein
VPFRVCALPVRSVQTFNVDGSTSHSVVERSTFNVPFFVLRS